MDPQDVFLPRLGPDTWMDKGWMDVVSGSAEVQKERVGKIEHTRRSISPGYRLWSAILLHDAGVCC